jgi:hypothetical protein
MGREIESLMVPFQEKNHPYLYQSGVGLSEGVRVGVEVDGVVVPDEAVVPPGLDVRNLQGITDGLRAE